MTRPIFHAPNKGPDGSVDATRADNRGRRKLLPVARFRHKALTGLETTLNPTIAVDLDKSSTSTVTVRYRVIGGTADANVDYTLATGTLTFAPGEVTKNLPLVIDNDASVESNETIIIKIDTPVNCLIGSRDTHTYTIQSEDVEVSNPTVSITSASSSTVDDDFAITITFSEAVTGFTDVDFTLSNCSISNLTGGPSVYTATVEVSVEGALTLKVTAGTVASASGGTNTESNTLSRTYTAPVVDPGPTVNMPLGVNLPGPDDWNGNARLKLPVDCMRLARVIQGNPATGSSKYRVLTTSNRLADYTDSGSHYGSVLPDITGTYLLDCDGGGTVTASGAAVQNVVTVSGHTTAEIVISSNEIDLDLNFSAAVSNVTLLRPGYARGTTQLTTNEFQDFIAPFSCIRFMNLQNTNWADGAEASVRMGYLAGSERQWNERPSASGTWNRDWGISVEAIVQICNECSKDGWLCFSHVDSTDFVQNCLAYIDENLNADLHMYIEWSNETWNYAYGFYQSGDFASDAVAYAASGASPVLASPIDNQYYYSARYSFKKMYDASAYARTLTGGIDRIRPVVASQYANPSFISDGLNWAKRKYTEAPSYYLYGIAFAPYVGAGTGTAAQIISDIIADFEDRLTWADGGKLGWWRGIASSCNFSLLMYESGIDMGQGTTNLTNKISAAYDADMQELILDYYNSCYSHGVELGCHFLGVCTRDKYGPAWGLTDDVLDLEQAMYLGALDFVAQEFIEGGLIAEFYDNTNFTTLLQTIEVPVVSQRHQAWSTTPPCVTAGTESTAPNNQSVRYSGKYTVQPGIVSLVAECDTGDTANLTVGTPFSGDVDVDLDYVASFSGNGISYIRLMQVDGSANRTMVPQSALQPV